MSSTLVHTNRQCVVCDGTGSIGRGDWMRVYHYGLPDGARACGRDIHENCRYADTAPQCPCGGGPADEGLTLAAVIALDPPLDSDDEGLADAQQAETAFDDRDEAVPTLSEELALLDSDSEGAGSDDDFESDGD